MQATDRPRLAHDLHVLVARLDRAAEGILRRAHATTYRRFRTLLAVHELGAVSQRAVADHLAVSEPSASRMVGVLVGEGLVTVGPVPGSRRHALRLTDAGAQLLAACSESLEGRFEATVAAAGIDHDRYAAQTRLLAERLAGADHGTGSDPAPADGVHA